jgi:hypothetical protein
VVIVYSSVEYQASPLVVKGGGEFIIIGKILLLWRVDVEKISFDKKKTYYLVGGPGP